MIYIMQAAGMPRHLHMHTFEQMVLFLHPKCQVYFRTFTIFKDSDDAVYILILKNEVSGALKA